MGVNKVMGVSGKKMKEGDEETGDKMRPAQLV